MPKYNSLILCSLILIHVIIFNVLFCLRFPPQDTSRQFEILKQENRTESILDPLRHYYGRMQDEAYYYEWSSLVLGKTLEESYPLAKRADSPVSQYYSEPAQKRIPYYDIPFEYPPLLMLPLLAARLMSHDYLGFTRALAFLASLFYLGSLFVSFQIWQRIPKNRKISWPAFLGFSALSVLFLGSIFVTRLDVFPSFLYLLALSTFLKEKYFWTALWVSLGMATKVYAVLLVPLFLMVLLGQKKYRALWGSFGIILVLTSVLNLGLGIVTEGRYWEAYLFHFGRGIQLESIYALVPYLAHFFWKIPIEIYSSHYCRNIAMPHGEWLLKVSTLIPPLLFLFLYGVFWKRSSLAKTKEETATLVVQFSLLLVWSFILSFKVLSPQFLIWLIPLVFLVYPERRALFFLLFIVMLILTQLIFPNFYTLLIDANRFAFGLLLVRNLLLIFLFMWLLKENGKALKIEKKPT